MAIEIISLGEAIIDFVSLESGVSLIESPGFEKAAGGGPANVAVGVARLGIRSGFMGKVGDDEFGYFLAKVLKDNDVDISALIYEPKVKTGLAFVSLKKDGERDFMFYRDPSADMLLSCEEINSEYIRKARIFHFGSISLISEPSKSATLKAVEIAKEEGILISYDPNMRLSLWENEDQAKEEIEEGLKWADVVKIDQGELEFITGTSNLRKGSNKILGYGAELVVVTLGKDGCYYNNRNKESSLNGFKVKAVDATGAGDGFVAGMLVGLVEGDDTGRKKVEIKEDALDSVMKFANAVGAVTTLRKGAIPALPRRNEVFDFIDKYRIT